MDINYIPFLKTKANEIRALADLERNIALRVRPFFDYPRKENVETEEKLARSVTALVKKFEKHLSVIPEFYLDVYDVDDVEVDGRHLYAFILEKFSKLPIIPVISIDRSCEHNDSVIEAKTNGHITSDVVAIRITQEYFQRFSVVHNDINCLLRDILNCYNVIDLIFDCRVCTNADVSSTAMQIANFANEFCRHYPVRSIIISGSSIPASIAEIVRPASEEVIQRKEVGIYRAAYPLLAGKSAIFGDYTTVSPDYSDANIPPEQMQNRVTAKFSYSFDDQHYFIRGSSIKTVGRAQYYDMASTLCNKAFFRKGNSAGDIYFEEKSKGKGPECWITTVIAPAINSHITYLTKKILASGTV